MSHRIITGDCLVEMQKLDKVDVCIFDPPYSAHVQGNVVGLDYVRTGAWVRAGAPQLTGDRPGTGFEPVVIAHPKGKKKWNGGGIGAVWHHATCHPSRLVGSNNTREHPTQKPLPLLVELVSLFSDPGETVLDCCAGSGTTGVAAVRLGRHFIGIEQQEKWATIARERCAAEDDGSDVVAYRAGQLPMFGAK